MRATKKPRKSHEKVTSKNATSNEKSSERRFCDPVLDLLDTMKKVKNEETSRHKNTCDKDCQNLAILSVGAPKGTELKWHSESPKCWFSQKTADLRRFTLSPGSSSICRAQETAENRRFPQKTAQETADWAPSPYCGVQKWLRIRFYYLREIYRSYFTGLGRLGR